MRKNIKELISSGLSAYRISKDTGITLSVIQKILNGTSKLDNISLKNAEILSQYWEDVDLTKDMQILEIDGIEYYTFPADYYNDEHAASKDGYYWDDEADRWTKEIIDNTTTIF